MTEHPFRLVRADEDEQRARPKHPLGQLNSARIAKHLSVFRVPVSGLEALMAKARAKIPGLTNVNAVARVLAHNPDCVWGIARRRTHSVEAPVAEGFIAMLPLNLAGLKLLAANALDTANPDPAYIAGPGERPAGIYIWATFAPGLLAGGVALFMDALNAPAYRGVDLFTRPNTADGFRFNETLGLQRGAKIGAVFNGQLYTFRRSEPRRPLYDSFRPDADRRALSVSVARTIEDYMRVVSLRSAVYIAEQQCPYEEEFDGNDFAATHLIGYVGREPAGCLRIRFFADFAKLERLAVRKEFRQTRLSFQLVRAGVELCRVKGYRRLYGHAQKRLVNFWSRFGFHLFEGGKDLVFSDFDYVEMVAEIERHPEAVTIGGDPYMIIRPEGRWHEPGVLESSASRDVTQPSVAAE